ncbi:hypothetical protein D3C71_1910530 [compost metagenome]
MGMGDRNGVQPAQRVNQRAGGRVQRGDAIPQDIAVRCGQQDRTLVDGKFGYGFKA